MLIEGVEVPARGVADLALRLHRAGQADLAQAIGLAVDGNRPAFWLRSSGNRADREAMLRALEDCPRPLAKLRAALLASQNAGKQALGL